MNVSYEIMITFLSLQVVTQPHQRLLYSICFQECFLLAGFTQAQNIQEKSIEYNNLMPNGIVKISIEHKEAMSSNYGLLCMLVFLKNRFIWQKPKS